VVVARLSGPLEQHGEFVERHARAELVVDRVDAEGRPSWRAEIRLGAAR
jgi:hypothetical protein